MERLINGVGSVQRRKSFLSSVEVVDMSGELVVTRGKEHKKGGQVVQHIEVVEVEGHVVDRKVKETSGKERGGTDL